MVTEMYAIYQTNPLLLIQKSKSFTLKQTKSFMPIQNKQIELLNQFNQNRTISIYQTNLLY
jgi:hypothetical protein